MAGIAKIMGENETERIWTAKVPPSLKQILIEDRAVTKVHFQLDRKISTIHTESREFQLVPTKEDWIPKTEETASSNNHTNASHAYVFIKHSIKTYSVKIFNWSK
ncbi:hypothetical protein FH972_010497 [Carpinus fangiana]|uniref:Uncharacterized protein n=1 Tax=Carpinus fangiana TaxID=176857 RepID=A0A660KNG3_9ROSI|nr:hypothetical protein FH972_010497 [Carpinus fangiana]